MEKEEIDKYFNGYVARLVFHLADTHGLPREESEKYLIDKDGYFIVPAVLNAARKHRDFVKLEKKYAQEIRKCP